MKNKIIIAISSSLFLILFSCDLREISMNNIDKSCEFIDKQEEYFLRCENRSLLIQKNEAVIKLLNEDRIIWGTNGFVEKGEFSGISFFSGTGYIGAKKIVLLDKDNLKFNILNFSNDTIGILNIHYRDEIFFLRIQPLALDIKSYGFSFLLQDGVTHYGIGEMTDENDIWRKLYNPTEQHFVLDNGSFERPYFQTDEGSNVITPLIMNSRGGFIFSDSYSHLSLSFNREGNRIFKIHLIPDYKEDVFELAFYMGENTKKAYEKWVNTKWRNRPDLPVNRTPSDELIKKPIWTTWALYKWAINREKVVSFADAIKSRDLPISYLEIDDKWTGKYGDLDFDSERFNNAKEMIDILHQYGIKVSLWVPPFVNQDADSFEDGIKQKAFMAAYNSRYPALVGWWDTANIESASIIDFFSESGREWFGKKIEYLVNNYGIDGFKYDAGEAQFLPIRPRLKEGIHPNMYSDYYARWGLNHHGVEMRSGYFSQNLPILFRQFDKASHWGYNNGLASVLTQILAMGIIGYPFVLPDMIGGNEYLNRVSEELFIRWVELNTFLPYMQFSIPPFREDFSERVIEITYFYLKLREKIVPYIINLSKDAALTQMPIVRPLFFEFVDDEMAYSIEDQFMLGSKYLVAPVITEGAISRKIYFPKAKFKSLYNPDEVIVGPEFIEDYPAPIEIIPVFERVE